MSENVLLTDAQEILGELLKLLEISGTTQPREGDDNVSLSILSEESGRIIGKKGQTLEALELVMNRLLRRKHAEEENLPWIILDVDGYHVSTPKKEREKEGSEKGGRHHSHLPEEEEERLKAMALDVAREVKKLGRSRVIGPFSPAERRIIHVTLENDPQVETVSDAQADENRGKKITVQLRSAAAEQPAAAPAADAADDAPAADTANDAPSTEDNNAGEQK